MSTSEIAVIGMAGRFPGAPNVEAFWANVRDGVESVRPLSDEELLAAGVSPADVADPNYVKVCPILEGIDQFDASFFGLNPRDASVMDPAHRLFLELAWEAMEHAGHTAAPEQGPIGVFAGSGASYYLMDHVRPNRALMRSMGEFLVRHTNNDMNFLATRVSYEMDLRGPSVNIQTACSTALVSVHMACESIRRGECKVAIAGGSTVLVPDRQGYLYQEGEIMSPDGHCRPFDARSAGTVFGSGSGCVVLKSLSAALDDGDTIHAVIKASAINNDGAQRVGFLAPGVEGQSAAVGQALDASGVPAETITYIEAHGTGTSVGDPIEVAALNEAYRPRTTRRRFCAIGSVKSNVGHLGEAAGIASLIKAIMALKHRQLPPSLGYETPNPQIDFDDSPFFVNDRLRPWETEGPLRCGVTALGAGGTNCHVILEEAPPKLESEGARASHLFVLSAKTPTALERARDHLAEALGAEPAPALADTAWTLAVGRRPMAHRCVVVAETREQAVHAFREGNAKQAITQRADDVARSVVFLFPGGGAQYPRMGADLFAQEPAYRDAANACFAIINPILGRRLEELLFSDPANTARAALELERPSLTLPALFATEYALAKLFESWGVEPTAFVGHSMGEYVAACLSGVMTLDEALQLVMLRGRLFEATDRGGMLSVPLGEADLMAILPAGLSVAAVNAPELCVASGPVDLIEAFERDLSARGIDSTRVRIEVAAHSAMLDGVLGEFRRFCRTIALKPPRIPFVSNVSGRWITAAEATDPDYWVNHLRSTVRFADCLETLGTGGDRVLLEVGPGRTLSTLARAQATPARHAHNAMRHADEAASDLDFALTIVGKLWLAGVPVDWTAFYDGQLLNRIPLPTYSWDHARHWIDAAVPADTQASTAADPEERRARVDDWFERPIWRQTLPPAAVRPGEGRVLVFADPAGFSSGVASELAAAGRVVIEVQPGAAWQRHENRFTIRPDALEDYESLVKALMAEGGFPGQVIHGWGVTEGDRAEPLQSVLDRGFHSLHAFAQALGNEDPDARFTLDVLTTNLQRIGGESLIDPAKALVLGPARVLPHEFPNVRFRAIDLALPKSAGARRMLAGLVAAEIASEPGKAAVAFRGADRFEQVLEGVRLDPVSNRVRDGGVYVITGGLGGIGYALAEHLARAHHAKLVLLGRGATATRARARVTALEALGAEVLVVQADVTDAAQLAAMVEQVRSRFGTVHGVFHAAGVLGDSLLALKTRADAERVLAPKVQGTLALDAAFATTDLDLFVLFSSISSIGGLPGQADYTAANAFLDAFAQERSTRTSGLTIAINWSAWRDAGMAANIASGAGAASGGDANEVIHPVLGRRIWAGAEADLFASDLAIDTHWVLAEHRLRGGRSLMPGTGHVEIVRAAIEARPEARVLEIRDLAFMSALVAPETGSREMRVHVARHGESNAVVIASRTTTDDGQQVWQEHVTASAGYVDDPRPAPLDVNAIAARCTVREERFLPSQESVHMDFGRRWKNLQSIRYGRGEALVSLQLPDGYADELEQYRLHPALLDMATGRCEALIDGFDIKTDFYVPLSYTKIRMFGPLTPRLFSHVRLAPNDFDPRELIVFDATITDESGRVLVEVEEFVMTRVTDTSQLEGAPARVATRRNHASFEPQAAPAVPPPMVQMLEGAIRSSEGMEALERILAGPAIAQVFATPTPVEPLIDRLRQPPTRPAPAAAALPEEPTVPVGEVEAALATHEVMSQCVVLQRRNRPGELKLVAYVVFKPHEHATVSDLRRFLKARVAESLVPSTFVELDALPVGSDGTVNRAALPDPFGAVDDTVLPRTETERLIADIWKEVLGVPQVGVHDNFFDAGGHSLLAVRVVVRIDKKIGVRLNQSVMVLQTLEQIAAECDKRRGAAASADAPPAEAPPAAGLGKRLFNALRGG